MSAPTNPQAEFNKNYFLHIKLDTLEPHANTFYWSIHDGIGACLADGHNETHYGATCDARERLDKLLFQAQRDYEIIQNPS